MLTIKWFSLIAKNGKPICSLRRKLARVDFINIFKRSFYAVAPKSVRTQSSCQYLFMLLRSTHEKVVLKMLMKLSPGLPPAFFPSILRLEIKKNSKKRGQSVINWILDK
jgi:hypothetical protein